MRACANCGASLEGRRGNVKFCGAWCRKTAWMRKRAQDLGGTDGNGFELGLTLSVGRLIREPLPDDWPERSARFWTGLRAIERNAR